MSTSTTGPFADWDETKEPVEMGMFVYDQRLEFTESEAVNGLVFDADRANYDAGAAHMRDTIMIAPVL